ncbi:MAG: polyphosphate polymerase domain-containing protein [Tissierellia bacterium]|nr:polyphosphate polymerase domain-containing protein [Tissierellia bacterium]
MTNLQASSQLAVYRREVKYLLSLTDRLYLLDALDALLTPDAYGGYNGYTVRSVYFDGIWNNDYLAKENKEDEKKRVRLRVYHPEDETAKFELKFKSFGKELKESLVISRADAIRILERDYFAFLNYDSGVARYAFNLMSGAQYRPVSIVEYDRRAYTHPDFNTRVTLDNNLRISKFSLDLFSPQLNFESAMPKNQTILEVKYDRFLFKQIQDVLTKCDLTKKPPSKFGSSRAILKDFYS